MAPACAGFGLELGGLCGSEDAWLLEGGACECGGGGYCCGFGGGDCIMGGRMFAGEGAYPPLALDCSLETGAPPGTP